MNIDPYYQRQNVLEGSLCGYSRGFAGRGRQMKKMTLKIAIFGAFAHYIFRTLSYNATIIIL